MEDQPTHSETDPSGGTIFTAHRKTQLFTFIASFCCFLIFWWAGQWVGIPREKGYQDSLLLQPAWPVDLVVTYLLLVISVIVATLIAGRSWFFAGLFAATIGLMALFARGGPMRYVLFDAAAHGASQSVYLSLLAEQVLLFVPIAVLWAWFCRSYQAAEISACAPDKQSPRASNPPGVAILAQVAIMGALLLLLAASDLKKQALVSVFVAGIAGSSLAEHFVPARKAAAWYWVGPFVLGAVGYLLAWLNATPTTTGQPLGTFANLARPLPLDYASAGSAGALLGYWIGAERPHIALSIIRTLASSRAMAPRTKSVPTRVEPHDNGAAKS